MNSGRQRIIIAVCILAIGLSGLYLFKNLFGSGSGNRINFAEEKVTIVAEAIAKVTPVSARILIVSLESPLNPVLAEHSDILKKSLAALGFTSITGEHISLDVFSPMIAVEGYALSADTFEQILMKHPDVDVVISMAGTPPATQRAIDYFSNGTRKLVLAGNIMDNAEITRWLSHDIISLMVLPLRFPPKTISKPPETAREIFNLYFKIVTP